MVQKRKAKKRKARGTRWGIEVLNAALGLDRPPLAFHRRAVWPAIGPSRECSKQNEKSHFLYFIQLETPASDF